MCAVVAGFALIFVGLDWMSAFLVFAGIALIVFAWLLVGEDAPARD